jgi:uracil phosphoribosyltransferase
MANTKTTKTDAKLGITVAIAGVLGAAAFMIAKTLARVRNAENGHSAAFAPEETDQDNFDQTRHAGPVAMRDAPQNWDEIDEQLDASFPSSDPPSFNPGTA